MTIVQQIDKVFACLVDQELTPGLIVMNPKFFDELVNDSTIRINVKGSSMMLFGIPLFIDKNIKGWSVVPKEWMIGYENIFEKQIG